MKLKSLEIHNILSIENIKLEFNNSGLYLIDGWNCDDNTANGAGKTSIWNALSYGLYGKLPRKVTVSEIVRRGVKSGYVKIELEVDNKIIKIERARPKKEVFTIDDEVIHTQEELEACLKLTYKQFLTCMYASQTAKSKFIELSDTDKKDFFLNLLNLSKFDSIRSNVDKDINQLVKQSDELKHNIEKQDIKIETYKDSIEDIDLLNMEINKLNPSDLNNKLQHIDIDKPDLSQFDELIYSLNNKLESTRETLTNLKLSKQKIQEIDNQILNLDKDITSEYNIECPHCEKDFVLVGNNSLTIEQLREKINNKKEKLLAAKKTLVEEINNSGVDSNKIKQIQEVIGQVNQKKNAALSDYLKNKEQYSEIKSKIQIRQSKIKDIQRRIDINNNIEDSIFAAQKDKKHFQVVLDSVNNKTTILKTLSNIYSPTGAPAYILDNIIDLFNQKISDYVSMIWPNASYMLLSYKENKNGEIKAKLSDKLMIAGKEVSLGSLSGGELKCLSLSIDLSILEILESMTGTHISPYILDEPFEGLDASNRERAVSMLERVAQSRLVYVIDHQSESKAMFSDTIRVEKTNGVSKIVR